MVLSIVTFMITSDFKQKLLQIKPTFVDHFIIGVYIVSIGKWTTEINIAQNLAKM
jgi:hypothetical protein